MIMPCRLSDDLPPVVTVSDAVMLCRAVRLMVSWLWAVILSAYGVMPVGCASAPGVTLSDAVMLSGHNLPEHILC